LYCSTLNQSDIDIANQNGINMNSIKFQYDFLNDGVDDKGVFLDKKLPDGLKKAFEEGREVIVFMNPPYATNKSAESYKTEGSRTDNEKTKLSDIMDNMGQASANLYAQFLYKAILLNTKYGGVKLNFFSPEGFTVKPQFSKFRKCFYNTFKFNTGFVFNASEFSGVEMNWPIAFTIWS